MKKIYLIVYVFICLFVSCLPVHSFNYREYTQKPYIGMEYNQALNQDIPFLLILAEPANLVMLTKLLPLGNMVYEEFNGRYNFCIINTSISDNAAIVSFFNPKRQPALYIIDTKKRTYTLIERKYYRKSALRRILTEFLDGTLFN